MRLWTYIKGLPWDGIGFLTGVALFLFGLVWTLILAWCPVLLMIGGAVFCLLLWQE